LFPGSFSPSDRAPQPVERRVRVWSAAKPSVNHSWRVVENVRGIARGRSAFRKLSSVTVVMAVDDLRDLDFAGSANLTLRIA